MEILWIVGGVIILTSLVWLAAANTTEAKAAKAKARAAFSEYERAGLQIDRPLLRGAVISGDHAGVRFEHYIIPAGKNTPARSVVSIPSSAPGEFHVHPETGGTKIVKRLGMVDEFQTGDPQFDRMHYFSGSTDDYVRAVFGDRGNLERVRAVFAEGFDQLEKSGTHLIVSRQGAEMIGIAELKSVVEKLAKLSLPPSVPGMPGNGIAGKQALHMLRAAMVVIVMVGGLAISAFLTTVPRLSDAWIDATVGVLPIVAALCAAILLAAYFGLKGRSMAARGMTELLAGLPILAMALAGILLHANERFDNTEAQAHEVRLLKRYTTSGRKSTRYQVEFESWRGRDREELTVPADTYALGREGQVWRLHTRRGWLGHVWIESLAPRE